MNIDFSKFKNNKYLVLLSDSAYDITNSINATFDNVLFVDSKSFDKNNSIEVINYINDNVSNLIFIDDNYWFRKIIINIKKDISIQWVFKHTISSLTSSDYRAAWNCVNEYYDRRLVDKILFLDKDMYQVYKNAGYKCDHLLLDVKVDNNDNNDSDSIGIISDDWDPNHNVYNQLSAVSMVDYSYVKLNQFMEATKHFVDFFNIKNKDVKDIDDIIKDNKINLYINFTSTRYEYVLKSMDRGIPCLLGNTDIFNEYDVLKQYLVVKQDDNIGEIAEKINKAIDNKDVIMKEYKKFRSDYSKRVKEILKTII